MLDLANGTIYDGDIKVHTTMNRGMTPEEIADIAIERIRYFIQGKLDSSILISSDNKDNVKQLHATGLRITTLPGDPVDQIIGIMLYSKLSAIMEDKIIVGEVEVYSDISEGIVYMHNEEESLGPFEGVGWWHNPDLTQCDTELLGEEKVMSLAKSIIWRELGLNWHESETKEDTGNTIIFTDFNRNETK